MHITFSLVSHTNVGKTTLARTLLRRDVGEVLDQAHVTENAEEHVLLRLPIEATAAREESAAEGESAAAHELRLWDTPGFGDSLRLLKRLRRSEQPILWFLTQAWDRIADRPFWCSQRAVLNVRDHADLVLYLVNATEDPESAGYVGLELQVLDWIGRPVVILLNQTGDLEPGGALERERVAAWKEATARFSTVRDVAVLDAFSRVWVQERILFERLAEELPEEDRDLMRRFAQAWHQRNVDVFDRSLDALAGYLSRVVGDREILSIRRPSQEEREQAQIRLSERLEKHTRELTTTLLAAHGLEGESAHLVDRQLGAFRVEGEEKVDPERGALLGGVVSGAVGGLAADLLAGGLTFGGGMLAGAILGALGGAGLARGYQLVNQGKKAAVAWTPPFLERLTEQTLLRYLAVAHFGRGRGAFHDTGEPERWRTAVQTRLADDVEERTNLWTRAAPEFEIRDAVDRALRGVLEDLYGAIESPTARRAASTISLGSGRAASEIASIP